MTPEDLKRRNRRTGIAAFGFVAFMVGVSFAAVPLYDLFCRMTGYNGTPMIYSEAAPGGRDGTAMTVRFNATVHPGLPWDFAPEQAQVVLRLGEEGMGFYSARNLSDGPVEGVSTYNVTPEVVGRYFHKVACFCFEAQTLAAGQEAQMPLAFWIDPKIAEDPNTRGIRTITVSYTFYRSLADAERAGALANAGAHVGRGNSVTR
ncbi:cytochrome c oxidase assembly protein [Humitalea sp. 24SJ18S-53]|uniref:cytochrome c oxidase assembly protein n=1 Tax=Humitalea sp. 24SJ18S-53 TaxID=3422307 RepID=UPI003D676BE6